MKKVNFALILWCAGIACAVSFGFASRLRAEYNGYSDQTISFDGEDLFLGQCRPPKPSPWQFGGWIEAGITVNNHGCTNSYDPNQPQGPSSRNLDAFSGNTYLLGTEQHTDFKLNQAWFYADKKIDTRHGFDWGFRCDTVYGTDARYGQCFSDASFDAGWGSGDYYLCILQLFAEIGYKNLKFRVGKFGSPMSYESAAATKCFFNSHNYAGYNTPLTFSGTTFEYTVDKRLTLGAGWTAGYHDSLEDRFNDNGFLGSVVFKPTERLGLSYFVYLGRANGWKNRSDAELFNRRFDFQDSFSQSLIFSYALSQRLTFVNEFFWARHDYENYLGLGDPMRARSYGLCQQFLYTINPKWSVGLRTEWLYSKGTVFDLVPLTGGEGANLYEISLGANWKPNERLLFKPEIRYDWNYYHNGFQPFDQKTANSQLTAGCAMIVKF